METLALGLETFGIWPALHIEDDDQRVEEPIKRWQSVNGKQGGDPQKLAAALLKTAAMDPAPARFMAGTDPVKNAEKKAHTLLVQADARRELSSSLGHD